jgi:hypothetical protein
VNRIIQTSKRLGLAAGLLSLSTIAVAPAMADTIMYSFAGNVTTVGRFLSPPAVPSPQFIAGSPGSPMTGTMTVNIADGNSGSSTFGSYSIQSLSVTIGGYTATVGPTGTVDIRNGAPGNDRFQVSAPSQPGFLAGDPINSLLPRLFTINLRGPNSILGSDELPSTVPSLSSFTGLNQFRLQFGPTNGANARVQGELTSLSLTSVPLPTPLPTSVILFGLGLVALVGLGAGGLRNIRLPQI